MNELLVSPEEQVIALSDGYSAQILFDPFYKRWYYNLLKDDEILYAGIALTVDTRPLYKVTGYYLGIIDKVSDNTFYEPFSELGGRLGLLEITE